MSPCPSRSPQIWSEPEQNRAEKLHPKPYLLFDAGGTLVFPDQPFLILQARKHGKELTHEQLFKGYYQVIHRWDREAYNGGSFPGSSWSQRYAYALFETLGMVNSATHAVARVFEARHRRKNLWTFTFHWIRETLSRLAAQGYRMSVISNSDGRTEKVFHDLNLAHYFDRIFDSAIIGIEKPDPAIFELALGELNLRPSDALYIGDIFEVDVRGANLAGVAALHLDPLGLYADWPGVHLPDVRHLPDWLVLYAAVPSIFDVYPTTGTLTAWPLLPSRTQHSCTLSLLRSDPELSAQTSDGNCSFNRAPHTYGDKP